jgi:hypothetical protein
MDNKTITLEKLIPGALSIELRNHQFGTTQRYRWAYDTDTIYVPVDLAVSIFTEVPTKKLYDKGYFRIRKDQEEAVLNKAVKSGFYHGKVEATPVSEPVRLERSEIETLLKNNNKTKVKELIERKDRVELENLVQAAIDLQAELTQSIIDLVEQELKVPIRIEDELTIEE